MEITGGKFHAQLYNLLERPELLRSQNADCSAVATAQGQEEGAQETLLLLKDQH